MAISAMEMSEPFWPLLLRQLSPATDNIALWSALIYGAPLMVSALIAPYWGRLGDRYGHKRMLLRASFGLALTQGLLYFSSSLWEVLACRLLQGALAGILTAVLCFANTLAPAEQRSLVVGKLTSATAAGAIFGPLIGGVLIEWLSFQALFAAAALVCLLITLMLAAVLDSDKPAVRFSDKPVLLQTEQQTSNAYGRIIWLFLLVIFLLQTAKAMPSSFFALYTEQYLDSTPFITGLLFSAAGVGMMISAPYWGQVFDRMQTTSGALVLALIALVAAACYQLHLQNSWLALLIVRFVWGLCLGAMLPMVQAMMINLTSQRRHGHIIGIAQRTIKTGNLTGVSLGALLLTGWDYQSGFSIAATVYLLSALTLLAIWDQLCKATAMGTPKN